jgi:N-acetyl-gamma-glutamyl-phosphate reductase
MSKTNVGIVGASGYTGSELMRILAGHKNVEINSVTSESNYGKKISDIFRYLDGSLDLEFIRSDDMNFDEIDTVFLALPHRISMNYVSSIWDEYVDIIDLSGDFRLSSVSEYEKWYETDHTCPELNDKAVFGLPELFREGISNSRFVANPGCYPTSAILGLAPFLKNKLVKDTGIIVDSKSGVTGAGAKVKNSTHYPSVNEDFRAYGLMTHRHTPEIEDALSIYTGSVVNVQFTPHLLPLNRGILTTIYCELKKDVHLEEVQESLMEQFLDETFIRIRDDPPSIKDVRGSNFCDIHVEVDERTRRLIIVTVIDNLVKGASGQAVQNMNIMKGFEETEGLMIPPLTP